jgi:hypothetical protein
MRAGLRGADSPLVVLLVIYRPRLQTLSRPRPRLERIRSPRLDQLNRLTQGQLELIA